MEEKYVLDRFDEDFMFQLSEDEYNNLRSKILTSSSEYNHGGRRYLPYVFTEQGIYMLMTVLKELDLSGKKICFVSKIDNEEIKMTILNEINL